MTRAMLLSRLRAHAAHGDSGFTLIETIIAITIIFASLVALAETATIGFKYVALSRERQAGAGIADQLMESVRGLASAKLTKGLSTSDLSPTTDPNIMSCSGAFYLEATTCTHTPDGDRIVA